MALGTPVAAAAAYSAAGGTTVTPAYPAGILATDVVLLFVGQKPSTANGGTVTTPTGWTLRDSLTAAGGYGATLGADTGNTNLFVYSWNTPVAGQTGNLSVTLGVNNVTWAFMVRIPTGGGAISYGSADGQQTATPTSPMTNALTNGATATAFQSGDLAIWAMCIPTDVQTPTQFSAQSVTATGATFATAVELNEPDSTTGNDIGGYSAYASVSSGSSTANPSVTVTLAGTLTNVRGPVVMLRVREIQAISFNAEVGSYSITGQAATTAASRSFNAEAGAYSLTGQAATLALTKELSANSGSYAITGQAADFVLAKSISADSGSYVISGQNAELSFLGSAVQVSWLEIEAAVGAYSIDAASGAYSISGQLAALTKSTVFSADSGAYVISGQPANFVSTRTFEASAGSYVVTGQPATFVAPQTFNAEVGSYSITGQAADLQYVAVSGLDAQAGSYVVTGQDATLIRTQIFTAGFGQYSISEDYVDPGYNDPGYTSGTSAALLRSLLFNLDAGNYAITGQNAGLSLDTLLNAEAGAYNISGQDASLLSAASLFADAGAYDISGQAASLLSSSLFNAASGSYLISGQAANLIAVTLYPNPADVRQGVVYGPGGIYTGTLVVGGNPIYLFDD
jgi:hypothetical protein